MSTEPSTTALAHPLGDGLRRFRADQTKQLLSLASKTLEYMRGGLSEQNCQAVCRLLLPETAASSVAMTDDSLVLAVAGRYADAFPPGSPIHTQATHDVIASQLTQVFTESRSRGAGGEEILIPAGIVAPLVVHGQSVGTLKMYYDAPWQIDDTQQAICEGFARLLSTQLSIAELDRQVELATKAELQALQAQINPHFLFNTINTIAALIRTDPMRAWGLLREFAMFYRQTLENSSDLIPLSREVEQTRRYLSFVRARFGDERIATSSQVEEGLDEVRVPSFIIQPIVENSVNHAMMPGEPLALGLRVFCEGDDVVIEVTDDGSGMSEETAAALVSAPAPSGEGGTGIALYNVDGRLKAVFGPDSGVTVSSRMGEGTCVTLRLRGARPRPDAQEGAADVESDWDIDE